MSQDVCSSIYFFLDTAVILFFFDFDKCKQFPTIITKDSHMSYSFMTQFTPYKQENKRTICLQFPTLTICGKRKTP